MGYFVHVTCMLNQITRDRRRDVLHLSSQGNKAPLKPLLVLATTLVAFASVALLVLLRARSTVTSDADTIIGANSSLGHAVVGVGRPSRVHGRIRSGRVPLAHRGDAVRRHHGLVALVRGGQGRGLGSERVDVAGQGGEPRAAGTAVDVVLGALEQSVGHGRHMERGLTSREINLPELHIRAPKLLLGERVMKGDGALGEQGDDISRRGEDAGERLVTILNLGQEAGIGIDFKVRSLRAGVGVARRRRQREILLRFVIHTVQQIRLGRVRIKGSVTLLLGRVAVPRTVVGAMTRRAMLGLPVIVLMSVGRATRLVSVARL